MCDWSMGVSLKHERDIATNTNVMQGSRLITNVKTFAERLMWARERRVWTQAQLAKEAGMSQSAIGNYESGVRDSSRKVVKLAQTLGVRAEWLANGHGDPLPAPASVGSLEPGPELKPSRAIPIVGVARGGPEGHINIDAWPEGQGESYVSLPTADPEAYVLKVRGDSMRPRIKSGEFIVVEPNMEAQQGDEVVVKLLDDGLIVKELLWIRDGEVSLGSVNDAVPPITKPLDEIGYMHRVAAIIPRGSLLLRSGH